MSARNAVIIPDMRFTVDLHCLRSGSGSAPVILLHGLFGSASNLGALARALADDYNVWSCDLRNHGLSPHADSMDLQLMAADVLRLMDAEGIDAAAVVGHSLGGKVAMQLALDQPARCNRLVVADIAPVASAPSHNGIFDALRGIDLRALKNRGDADKALQAAVADSGVRQFLLKNLGRDAKQGWRWKMNLDVLTQDYDAVLAAPEGDPYPGPVLFIKGAESDYINADTVPAMQRLFPAHRLEVIPGAGHWLHAEKPAAFNYYVQSFLKES